MNMMATKLTDSELAERVRAGNRRRAQRQHEQRRSAGMVQLVTWITTTTKAALMNEAERRGQPIGETAAALLQEALNSYSPAERLEAVTAAMGNHNG
jgi:hypothetical protein